MYFWVYMPFKILMITIINIKSLVTLGPFDVMMHAAEKVSLV